MREEIRKTKKLTEKPFGVNLIPTPENDIWTPPILQVIKEEGVKAVVYTGYGEGAIITSLFNELKESGIAIIYRDINPTPENTQLPLPDGIHSMTISFYMPHTKAIRVFFLTSGFHFYVLYVH